MSKLCSIEIISSLEKHPHADSLSIASVLNYKCIVKNDVFKTGQKIVFIQPDCVLPNAEWAQFYRAKSNRTKAIRLRKIWSQGIIESLEKLNIQSDIDVGAEVSPFLGISKYEPPIPQSLDAKCNLRFGLTKTDEERWENIEKIPYGQEVIVTLKIDGQSCSLFATRNELDNTWETGLTSRQLELKPEYINNYTRINQKYNILDNLLRHCRTIGKSLCIRGEVYGQGIQSFNTNPHSKVPLDFAAFNLLNLETMKYEPFPLLNELCESLGIPVVPIVERATLTPELIKKYSEELTTLNGTPFEGVVIKLNDGQSFKVINQYYDSKK